ncbi:hypothetical protein V8F20_004155 [Naviculisporaceae sp. PSN 640]
MSGFEVAGIVLAAFTVLVDAGKDSKGLIRKAKDWWKFGLAFEDFLLRLDTERDDPLVQDELRRRITPRYYDWYINVLSDIHQALEETMDILQIGEIRKLDARGTEDVLFRFKTSFSGRKEKLLNRIQGRNEEIFKFLSREFIHPDNVVTGPRHAKRTSDECKRFLECQKRSRNLYEALGSVWQCKCSPSHRFSIRSAPCERDASTASVCLLIQSPAHASLILTRQTSEEALIPKHGQHQRSQGPVLQDIPDFRFQVVQQNKSKAHSSLKGKGIFNLLGKSISKQRVTFGSATRTSTTTVTTSQTVETLRQTTPITPNVVEDICSCVETAVASTDITPLGILKPSATAKSGDTWELHLRERDICPDGTHIADLREFLISTPARQRRMQVALDIALNILSLSRDWIPPDLDKSSLTIFQQEPSPEARQTETYISYHPLCRILLLELLFGQTIESQPYRQAFMGPNGKPNAYTDMCTAMEWQKRVELEVGDGLPQVIQRCVECDFGAVRDLSDPKFVKGVLEFVVSPLREFLSRWNSAVTLAGAASTAATLFT